ncbi:MAG TPA: hypothetical protein DDX47_01660 [Candidatus Jacksonbacteria bacterium]|nr:MAG: hypothetical protein A2550_03630 [Candidatus Jacksonbacteria bacterium RIFOXYD2_FULL_43_21]HBH46054.1 hypothetical protein [Candidatus Jacksonbacteria bacterium]
MKFIAMFTIGKIKWDTFSELFDTDRLAILLEEHCTYDKRLRLGVSQDMFIWRYKSYELWIGFLGEHYSILKVELAYCEDWEDREKAIASLDNPIKSVICKSKDDVTKAISEMLGYVKQQENIK